MSDALERQQPQWSWEVVIVDNGSTDDTCAIAEERAEALPIRVVEAPDKQAAFYARNVGAAASTGGSLLFLDHDDVIAPGYLEAMRSALGTSDIVAGRLDVHALNAEWAVESRPEPVAEGLFDHFGFLPYAPSCALGIGRAVFGELGGFADVPFAEDVDFCWRAQLAGKRICSVPEALVHYRYRSTLRAIFGQACRYGRAQPLLYRRYRNVGMPGRTLRHGAADWHGLVPMLVHARSRSEIARIVFLLGVYVGRLAGSLRHWVVYL